jgi:hypothetical protein
VKTITLSDGGSITASLSGDAEISLIVEPEVIVEGASEVVVRLCPEETHSLIGALVGLAAADVVGDFVRKLKGES